MDFSSICVSSVDFSTVIVEAGDVLGSSQLSQRVAQKTELLFADRSKQARGNQFLKKSTPGKGLTFHQIFKYPALYFLALELLEATF